MPSDTTHPPAEAPAAPQAGSEAASGAKAAPVHGIATIANDKVYDWLVPFLESWRQTNAGTPLHVIPYDDNCERTKLACAAFGATFVEPDNAALDALAKRLYPLYPHHRRRLRKFLSLALPLDEVIYVDVDIVLLRDLSCFFGLVEKGRLDFIVAAPTKEYVYNRRRKRYPFLKDKMLFNDGFFVTSNTILPVESFHEVIERDEATFHAVRQRGMLFAQPLTNFVTHRKELVIQPIFRVLANASGESFYKARKVRFDADGLPIDKLGDRIFFAHWAGAVSLPKKRVFDAAWLAFAAAGKARLADADRQARSPSL